MIFVRIYVARMWYKFVCCTPFFLGHILIYDEMISNYISCHVKYNFCELSSFKAILDVFFLIICDEVVEKNEDGYNLQRVVPYAKIIFWGVLRDIQWISWDPYISTILKLWHFCVLLVQVPSNFCKRSFHAKMKRGKQGISLHVLSLGAIFVAPALSNYFLLERCLLENMPFENSFPLRSVIFLGIYESDQCNSAPDSVIVLCQLPL